VFGLDEFVRPFDMAYNLSDLAEESRQAAGIGRRDVSALTCVEGVMAISICALRIAHVGIINVGRT
jgi:hypothetical protein